jgi:hypothetical protein
MTSASRLTTGLLVFTLVTAATSAAAQWINHPTPGMPRTLDGKPDLSAPVPRTPDGKPDLSGVWAIDGLGHATNITDTEMLPWAQALYEERVETYSAGDPTVGCLPDGPRAGISGLEPLRIIQTPNLVTILYESGHFRQIYLDARSHPHDPTPSWMGYSVGRWDGDTLVIETTGYNDKTWLDFSGHPHSDALRVTERFRRTDFGRMQLAMTFDDPKTYTKPWTINAAVSFLPDTDLIETVCLENEKDRERLVGRLKDERSSEKTVARSVLSGYVGTYQLGPLGRWQVSLDGDQLKMEMSNGGGRQSLIAQSDTAFMFPSIGGVVRFVPDAQGVATHFILTVVEGDFEARREGPAEDALHTRLP